MIFGAQEMGWTSRTGAIAGEGAAAGPDTSLGTRAGLVKVYAGEPLPPALCFSSRRLVVGRDPSSDLVLASESVSRRQAEIVYAQGAWTIADLGSRNGTFVNGQTAARAVLKHGDLVRLGDLLFTFVRADADGYAKHEPQTYGDLVGGYRVHRLVQAISRVAPSAIAVRLKGERGSEMDACARILHERSGKGGELRSIRCTHKDVREIGAILFGAPRESQRPKAIESPYRRADDAPPVFGTVFFDDIDIAPNTVEWLARTAARHPDLRCVFGTPAWVEESPLWRYSISLMPLRDRKEDLQPICLDELARLGRRDLGLHISFFTEVVARGLDEGVEGLRRLVRTSAAAAKGPMLTSDDLPPADARA